MAVTARRTDGMVLGDVEPALTHVGAPYPVRRLAQLELPTFPLRTGRVPMDAIVADAEIHGHLIGFCVCSGALAVTVRHGDRTAGRLVTPGGWLLVGETPDHWTALRPTVVAALDERFAVAAATAPELLHGLAVRAAEQIRRVQHQHALSQLPRVSDRIVAWFTGVADELGEPCPGGTFVELALTHRILGEMVGARRPTVTLALHDLAEDGRLVAVDRGWRLAHAVTVS